MAFCSEKKENELVGKRRRAVEDEAETLSSAQVQASLLCAASRRVSDVLTRLQGAAAAIRSEEDLFALDEALGPVPRALAVTARTKAHCDVHDAECTLVRIHERIDALDQSLCPEDADADADADACLESVEALVKRFERTVRMLEVLCLHTQGWTVFEWFPQTHDALQACLSSVSVNGQLPVCGGVELECLGWHPLLPAVSNSPRTLVAMLNAAVQWNACPIVEFIVEHALAPDLDYAIYKGRTVLMQAVCAEQVSLVRFLLTLPEHWIDLNKKYDSYYLSAFSRACFQGSQDLVRAFLDVRPGRLDVNSKSGFGRTALWHATPSILRILLSQTRHPVDINMQDDMAMTLAMCAIDEGVDEEDEERGFERLDILLSQPSCRLDLVNNMNFSLLDVAVEHCKLKFVQRILAEHASRHLEVDLTEAFYKSITFSSCDLACYFLEHHADCVDLSTQYDYNSVLQMVDIFGQEQEHDFVSLECLLLSPPHAAHLDFGGRPKALCNKMLDRCRAAGLDFNARFLGGKTLVMLAILQGAQCMVEALLSKTFESALDLMLEDDDGNTAFMVACKCKGGRACLNEFFKLPAQRFGLHARSSKHGMTGRELAEALGLGATVAMIPSPCPSLLDR